MTVPQQQKAWVVARKGVPSEVLELREDVRVASLCKGEVLVKIAAAAMNPLGYKAMQFAPTIPGVLPRPHVAEYDFSGVVVETATSQFNIGDEVYGFVPPFNSKAQGSFCQYAVVPADHVVAKPPGVSWIDAAGLGLAGVTAWGAIVDVGKITTGSSVFINGGTTAVGLLALQIAKAKGCKVTVTTSTKNVEFVRSLGADEVIDYRQNDPVEYFTNNPPTPRFDVIFDAIIKTMDLYNNSELYLHPDGVFISVGAPVSTLSDAWNFGMSTLKAAVTPGWAGGVKRRFARYSLGSTGFSTVLVELNQLIESGEVKPIVDSVYEFDEAQRALERIMTDRARGKVVLKAPVN